jgi:cell wall-associated NlpC family hydrolase
MSSSPIATPTLLHRPSRPALAALALAAVAALTLVLTVGGSRPRPPAQPKTKIRLVAEVPDPLAAQSFPDPAGARTHASAATPSVAAASVSPGAPTTAQVNQQLALQRRLQHSLSTHQPSLASDVDVLTGAFAPRNVVPLQINQVIAAGNAIADFPYVYGGGHASFVDRAYDCSGSVSYALAAAGLLAAPETSGQLEHWGASGPGRYLTVFANAGHTFMNVDGVWFDTAGRAGPHSTRWLTQRPPLLGYVARHYPGL